MNCSRRTPKTQCKACLSYWSEGIVYCTCGPLLKETVANRRFIVQTLDFLSIPQYVIKKGRPHGHRYGKTSRKKEHHLAHNLKKRCIKRGFAGIHDCFLQDYVFRERMIQHNRDEEVCRAWDVLAEQDHTYRMSEAEYFHYRQNWWISLNKSGNYTQPVRKRSHINQALFTSNRLHQETRDNNNSGPYPTGSTRNGDRHRVLLPPGGNGENPGGLLKNSKKVKKEAASKGLRSNGATRLFTELWRKPFYVVTDRSFTADGGLRCKDNTSKDPFSRCVMCKNLGYRLS